MDKQTRLNFKRTPTKRRRLDSDNEPSDEELENKSSSQRSRPQSNNSTRTKKSKSSNNTSPPTTSSQQQKPKSTHKSNSKSNHKSQTEDLVDGSHSEPPSRTPAAQKPTKAASPPNRTQDQTTNTHLTISHLSTSLFASPPNTVLCHATNAQGTWGAGIAAAFKTHYPSAFKLYFAHCKKWPPATFLGTTLLVPPQLKSPSKSESEAKHWIGCLFTSEKKGKGKGSKESILEATGEAVADLMRKVGDVNDDVDAEAGDDGIVGVRMCKINSGLFGVPWEASKAVIEGIEVEEGGVREIVVCSVD